MCAIFFSHFVLYPDYRISFFTPLAFRFADYIEVPTDVLHPELYNRLVAWRNAEASALGLPVYTVIQQKAILGISNLLPSDKAMLVRIPYFGKKGAEKYGDVILEMVRVYRKEKGLAEPELL